MIAGSGRRRRTCTIPEYLASHAPGFADSLALGLSQMAEGILPFELTLDQMPRRLTAGGRTFDVLYTPVGAGETADTLLVIFNDVTEHMARERAEREQKDLIAIFQRILIDRTGVEEYLAEATKLVTGLETERDPVVQRRLVHTLKGNSAMYGLGTLADLAHDVETQMAERDHAAQRGAARAPQRRLARGDGAGRAAARQLTQGSARRSDAVSSARSWRRPAPARRRQR